MTRLNLTAELLDLLHREAERCFPHEACGLLIGNPGVGGIQRFVPMENLQNPYHRRDPDRFPRDARTAFWMDPLQVDRLVDAAHQQGEDLIAVFHSHPDHPAYFSDTDIAAAAPLGFPNYPQAWQIVVSVLAGKCVDLKAFFWSDESAGFEERSWQDVPGGPADRGL